MHASVLAFAAGTVDVLWSEQVRTARRGCTSGEAQRRGADRVGTL